METKEKLVWVSTQIPETVHRLWMGEARREGRSLTKQIGMLLELTSKSIEPLPEVSGKSLDALTHPDDLGAGGGE